MSQTLKKQIENALTDMKKKVGRNEKHIYISNESGEWLQGVSSVSSIIPKDWLASWGAKEAVKFLGYSDYEGDIELAKKILDSIKKFTTLNQYLELLKEAKKAPTRKSKQALLDGKRGHEWLELLVQSRLDSKEPPSLPDDMLKRPLLQFLEWEKSNIEYWIASEAIIAYPEKGYAGQLDAIAKLKRKDLPSVVDFKFSSNISEDYYLQTAGYQAAFEAYNIEFGDRIIVRLPKTLERDEWDVKEWKYKKVENKIEVKIVPTKYEVDRNVFFACLPIKQWINYVQKLQT